MRLSDQSARLSGARRLARILLMLLLTLSALLSTPGVLAIAIIYVKPGAVGVGNILG